MSIAIRYIGPGEPGDLDSCRALRTQVFVQEQGIASAVELDERDSDCSHVLITRNGQAVATGRMLPEGRIGRMAVTATDRHKGYGRMVLDGLMAAAAANGLQRVSLHAQHGAVAFYQNAGFQRCGDDFIEAGILHTPMERATDTAPEDFDAYLNGLATRRTTTSA